MRVSPGQVEQINSGEGDEEATEEGESADSIGRVEALEENERSTQCCRSKGDIVERVDTTKPGQ